MYDTAYIAMQSGHTPQLKLHVELLERLLVASGSDSTFENIWGSK